MILRYGIISVMRHFRIRPSDVKQSKIILSNPSEIHHLVNVLRYKVGEEVFLLDGQGKRYHTAIISISPVEVVFQVLSTSKKNSPLSITLAQAVVRGSVMDEIIEKAVELGVQEFIPLKTDRISLNAERLVTARLNRWNKIIESACKQSGQTIPTMIKPYQVLKGILTGIQRFSPALFLTLDPSARNLIEVLNDKKGWDHQPLLLLVGPEGGWTQKEESDARQAGCLPVRLAQTTLRCETAVVSALAILTSYYECITNFSKQ